ncbi:Leucine-rich repeat and WD repeat-containing protein 1 [Chionoecetes opilio]|uniref:Leucine-rich repeat and WD repeat-containing protein 1 n=1 Tax=Chionoecetes opilio TaxID=41210 RepID=A0A8J8WMP9_CHIOP|nr:Leucine-rich repeat and WD repeat-containing protein 1 [Chionoecetes opilio]
MSSLLILCKPVIPLYIAMTSLLSFLTKMIWQCCFEPSTVRAGSNTSIVATCGGSSVCFINMQDGEVVLKYNRSTKTATAGENLYAQVWSTLPLDDLGLKTINVLAAAGARSTVLLIHPDAGVCYQMFRTVPNKAAAVVCALLFHPKKATWLFCGHEDGQIQLWDIGTPTLPEYEVSQVHLLTIPQVARDVYNLAFCCTHDLLIGGCDGGLYAWKIDLQKIETNERVAIIGRRKIGYLIAMYGAMSGMEGNDTEDMCVWDVGATRAMSGMEGNDTEDMCVWDVGATRAMSGMQGNDTEDMCVWDVGATRAMSGMEGNDTEDMCVWDVGATRAMSGMQGKDTEDMCVWDVGATRAMSGMEGNDKEDMYVGATRGHTKKLKKTRLERIEFVLPEVDGNGSVLDSVAMLRDDLLAAKCALHGQIYVFSITKAINSAKYNKSLSQLQTEVKASMMISLRWSNTDNYYMNMGVDPRSCVLVCGDDKGALWVYDLADHVTGKITSPLIGGSPIPQIEPVKILEWPELEDAEVEKARKLRLDTYDIVVDKCGVSYGAEHIVAVTSNNMVCIWNHGKEEEEEEGVKVEEKKKKKEEKEEED